MANGQMRSILLAVNLDNRDVTATKIESSLLSGTE